MIWFYSQIAPESRQNCQLRFSSQCLSRRFHTCIFRLDCPMLCFVLQNGNLIRLIVKKFSFNWTILINKRDCFGNNLLDICYQGPHHQTSIFRNLLKYDIPEKCHCMANFWADIAKMWMFLTPGEKQNAFQKNYLLPFVHQGISWLFVYP